MKVLKPLFCPQIIEQLDIISAFHSLQIQTLFYRNTINLVALAMSLASHICISYKFMYVIQIYSLWLMVNYSNLELTDMYYMYGLASCIGEQSRRISRDIQIFLCLIVESAPMLIVVKWKMVCPKRNIRRKTSKFKNGLHFFWREHL